MKYFKVFVVALCIIFLSGCSAGVEPNDSVGLAAAFAHCAGTLSYWVWGVLTTLAVGTALWFAYKGYKKSGNFSNYILFAAAAVLLIVWCYRPSELAWNTTVEQAARGVWIGY